MRLSIGEKLMKVKASFFGSIKQATGHSEYDVVLSKGSKLMDLINRLGQEFGEEFKESLIPDEKSGFPLLILIGNKDHRFVGKKGHRFVCGMDAELYEGVKVYFYPAVAGG
jgi:molybdopterin converting factor small subunit